MVRDHIGVEPDLRQLVPGLPAAESDLQHLETRSLRLERDARRVERDLPSLVAPLQPASIKAMREWLVLRVARSSLRQSYTHPDALLGHLVRVGSPQRRSMPRTLSLSFPS